ncbi:probable low-specificity L-threonine aldolase 2 [Athalia rosae]|uniref:probable low-specificity L-threonine aldolase 2 n=1 Tax=Athalia rosae TaxID=37344 RepID=UPI00203320DD|nr:probable low-specificity L-threonine aldolase 2 [Athalia rosae]XP_048508773.1 probable low-specificity L-threonine aldolase 2 [Athalia rosae]XP_048508775.1 probable low-specificity L-threonine aldolase 2 [Athalia rosae]
MAYGGSAGDQIHAYAFEKNATVVDLRSDTISKPSLAMRQAMLNAVVGDDVYEEDPTVKLLEEKAASLLDKEAALYVPSGTMGNLIAIMNHCNVRGSEAYCGDQSHTFLHEQGGAAQLAGVTLCTLPNNRDGTFDLKTLEGHMRSDRLHEPISKLVLIENTINGKILPQSWIDEVAVFVKKYNLRLHMDGARLWNASIGSGIAAKEIVRACDSVTFCLSKGLGAPIGSVLCGSKAFIQQARRTRKALGGGMRQVGVLAAAGLVALEQTIPILKEDHRRALWIAKSINNLRSKVFSVDLDTTKTNMIMVNVVSEEITAITFIDRLEIVVDDVEDDRTIVRGLQLTSCLARFVLYYEIDDQATEKALRKICYVIKKLDTQV